MRGTRRGKADEKRLHGIIPAYAGNTRSRSFCRVRRRDHPRVCGEHKRPNYPLRRVKGSSPRMRGTPWSCRGRRIAGGIIPAYAGNTMAAIISSNRCRDHPRVCGEHKPLELSRFAQSGSSPRMRGTLADCDISGFVWGIIPAYAGNTKDSIYRRIVPRDHPRVCGEHLVRCCSSPVASGSSPRMRGTL